MMWAKCTFLRKYFRDKGSIVIVPFYHIEPINECNENNLENIVAEVRSDSIQHPCNRVQCFT